MKRGSMRRYPTVDTPLKINLPRQVTGSSYLPDSGPKISEFFALTKGGQKASYSLKRTEK